MIRQYMRTVDFLVVMPVGPGSNMTFVGDTLASMVHYTSSLRRIILVDNTGTNSCRPLQSQFPDIDVVVTPEVHGKFAGIYLTTSLGYLHAVMNYTFKVILRMDTDALVTGDTPEQDAISFLSKNAGVGALGSYMVDCNGEPRNFSQVGMRLKAEASFLPPVAHPRLLRPYLLRRFKPDYYRGFLLLCTLRRRALANGYQDGEHFMGGAVFMSGECIQRLAAGNILYRRELLWSRLAEDHLFSLMVRSVGMEIADFATTHKGQIFPLNFITARVYHGYDYGLQKLKDMQIYTSSGVGTWGPPIRVGNIPEVVVIKFEQ